MLWATVIQVHTMLIDLPVCARDFKPFVVQFSFETANSILLSRTTLERAAGTLTSPKRTLTH